VNSDFFRRAGLLFLLLIGSVERAQGYMDYAPNEFLFEQVRREPYRILPRSEKFVFALDADFFKPIFLGANDFSLYKFDFYHGNGYWLSFRSEFRPVDDLSVNVKFDFTQGTSSNGPTFLAFVIPHVGFTYRVRHFLGFEWEFRLSDIVRQTIGTGLFVEMKETVGGSIIATRDDFRAKLMVDGTGSFRLDGGLAALEFSYREGLLGATILVQEVQTEFRAPRLTGTVYSRGKTPEGFGYGVETGVNANAQASLAYLELEQSWGLLETRIKPQYRHYGRRILGDLPGKVIQNFVSYDQNDKPYTMLMNIMPFGDDVDTFTLQADAQVRFNSFYRVFAETEYVSWFFRQAPDLRTLFFRTGFRFTPFRGREDEFGFLVGNRYLNASTLTPVGRTYSSPVYPDLENKPLFIRQLFWMVNYSLKL
jgi:hypothetical protein